ncbi:Protein N-acetyltransferase, RimJ/RimL family [Nocardioides alpinus]|uniref:N-acetyltransferase n=1 Tax=Nocardioides alpinus TaxID=748909 RepID=A0A1I1A7X3_9ACTN|nr:GNAT family N-acetyltransferase [Nocardioides alpinus]PKH43392.1 N-acetyltransferase [Nocardioides alpinus]SFB34104.1 Protein N-acetyltransferase, RimJ/RimL family [Nocardioides alpinus]
MLPEPTARLRFRPMTMADLDDMTAVLSAPDPVRVDRPARSRDDAVRWIEWQERNYAAHDFGLWVVETHDGEFVGDCGLTVQDVEGTPHVEVGYHVMPGLRRHGYATEAATAVRDCAAAAGIEHLVALIRPENLPSQGVARKLGMHVERTAHVHGGSALVLGMRLHRAS